ncbi:MAG: hypothetical protein GX974_09605 [Clostridiales bacterium]|nr:hypothetical protein [Clostridiales bacterium]
MKPNKLLIFILFLLSLLVACQKTPENPIVKGKDIDNIIKKGVENPTEVDIDSGEDLKKPIEAPERLKLETEGVKGNLKIDVDADIFVPNAKSMPIARVAKRQFDEEDVENFFKVLCGDAKVIDSNSMYSSEYYLKQVQDLREMKKAGSDHDKAIAAEEIDKTINSLLEKAANAPDSYVEIEPDLSFKKDEDSLIWPYGEFAHILSTQDDKTLSEIIVIKDYHGTSRAEYRRDSSKSSEINTLDTAYSEEMGHFGEDFLPPSMDQDEARKLAEDTILKLGLKEFECTGERLTSSEEEQFIESDGGVLEEVLLDQKRNGMYEFMFTRKINDVPILYTNNEGLTTVHDAYFEPWMYEKIHIFVDDEGIFYLKWNSPYEVKEIVSDASKLLSFSEVQDILKNMLPIKYDYMDTDTRYSYTMNITEARLGLMRVTEKDVGDSGLIIPVWDFFGTLSSEGKTEELASYEDTMHYTHVSFITINAIDGTIIDRVLGY